MWTRAELKARAKANLRKYFWAAFAVSLIVAIFQGGTGNTGSTENGNTGGNSFGYESEMPGAAGQGVELPGGFSMRPESIGQNISSLALGSGNMAGNLVQMVLAGFIAVVVIVGLVLSIFVAPVLEVGKNRFYMESRLMGKSAGFGKLFWGFSHGYLKIVGARFLQNFIITMICVACMAPGMIMIFMGNPTGGFSAVLAGSVVSVIVTAPLEFGFLMVPYILTENPDMGAVKTLKLSREMMMGNKLECFYLSLSFMGWIFLGLLCFGVGVFFVRPYVDATFAELYAVLRGPHKDKLAGFGMPDVVPSDEAGGQYVDSEESYGREDGGSFGQEEPQQNGAQAVSEEPERDTEVKRSEGGPGRGYYLNGVFHPYTEDDEENGGN